MKHIKNDTDGEGEGKKVEEKEVVAVETAVAVDRSSLM
jgi:hypothetical protein